MYSFDHERYFLPNVCNNNQNGQVLYYICQHLCATTRFKPSAQIGSPEFQTLCNCQLPQKTVGANRMMIGYTEQTSIYNALSAMMYEVPLRDDSFNSLNARAQFYFSPCRWTDHRIMVIAVMKTNTNDVFIVCLTQRTMGVLGHFRSVGVCILISSKCRRQSS